VLVSAISRGGVVYVRGYRSSAGRLIFTRVRRPLVHGRYTLTLRTRHGRRTVTRRTTITLG
jgi:hypothetical protein